MDDYRSTNEWLHVFQINSRNVHHIRFDTHRLSFAERERITASIQDFQLGESSEGHTLRKYAIAFAKRYGIPAYQPLMDLFIAEENRHSVYLGRFMKQHRIPRQRQTFNDSIFRWIRSRMGIELSIRTLVTAEIVALTYYQALAVATDSQVLRGICQHMLGEEEAHVSFQMQHIQFMNLQKWGFLSRLCDGLHRLLLWAALLAVWYRHRSVLRMRFGFWSFMASSNRDFSRVLKNGRQLGARMIRQWRQRPQTFMTKEVAHVR